MSSLYKLTFSLIFSLSLIGCGSENTEPKQTDKSNEQTEETNKQALPADAMLVKVALTKDYSPYGFVGKEGKPVGYNVDFIKAIAKEENFQVEFVIVPWLQFADSLASGKIDVGFSTNLVGTEEQKAKFISSNTYLTTKIGYGVQAESAFYDISDLDDKSVSVQKNTYFVDLLKKSNPKANIKEKTTTYLAYADVISKKTNAVFGDGSLIGYQEITFPEYPMRFIPDNEIDKAQHIAFSASENKQEIINKINAGFDKIKANGKYQKINEKWFGKHANEVAIN